MEKELFIKILNKCEVIAKEGDELTSSLNSFNLKDTDETFLEKFRIKLSETQSKMDRLLKIDTYHLIGMGNLSGSQMLLFAKAIKSVGRSASGIKKSLSFVNGAKIIISSRSAIPTYESKELGLILTKSN